MSGTPPENYVAYPRGVVPYDPEAADRLQALSDGYFGLNMVFLVNVALAIGGSFLVGAIGRSAYIAFVIILFLTIAGLSFGSNKKIGYGLGWAAWGPVVASVLMGLNSALCCGIIGFVVVQQMATKGISRYGLRVRPIGGFRKGDIVARIEELRAGAAPPPV
jgi:hypothetical protein